jgi:hypothetical protein
MDSFQTFQGTLTTYTGAKLPTSRSIYTEMQLDSLRNEGWCGANRAIFDRQVEWAGGTGGWFCGIENPNSQKKRRAFI